MDNQNSELLFSYGTLRYESVQIATFGRTLVGQAAILPGFKLSTVEIKDPHVIATSGESFHPIISYTGNEADQVQGMVFEVSGQELKNADAYEVADYKRISVPLTIGTHAWVYVNTNDGLI